MHCIHCLAAHILTPNKTQRLFVIENTERFNVDDLKAEVTKQHRRK